MKKKLFAAGCYGTGNLGDDAIFAGLRNQYSENYEICQIYVYQPTHNIRISELELIENGFPDETTFFVVGGGGLFYDSSMCDNMILYTDLAVDAGIEISLEGVGLESAREDCYDLIKNILGKCETINVRSLESKKIANQIGFEATVTRDFAYNILPDVEKAKAIIPEYEDELPLIGVATAGGIQNLSEPVEVISILVNHFNVLHIPHVRHLISPYANEIAKGELIFSSLGCLHPSLLRRYKCLPYPETPECLLGIYTMLDGILGYRYHSCIFAEMANVPVYSRSSPDSLKIKMYFDEHLDTIGQNDTREFGSEIVLDSIQTYFRSVLNTHR